jgi:hypothetical protein
MPGCAIPWPGCQRRCAASPATTSAQSGANLGGEGVWRLSRCVAELCHGQSLDLSFEQRDHIEMGECLAMSAAKTTAVFGRACSLGALAGRERVHRGQLRHKEITTGAAGRPMISESGTQPHVA